MNSSQSSILSLSSWSSSNSFPNIINDQLLMSNFALFNNNELNNQNLQSFNMLNQQQQQYQQTGIYQHDQLMFNQSNKRAITGSNNFQNQNIMFNNNNSKKSNSYHHNHNNQRTVNKQNTKFSSQNSISSSLISNNFNSNAIYSRKVFIGGLPPDIDESKNKFYF